MGCSSLLIPPSSFHNARPRDRPRCLTPPFQSPAPLPRPRKPSTPPGVALAEIRSPSTLLRADGSASVTGDLRPAHPHPPAEPALPDPAVAAQTRRLEKELRRHSERTTYLFAAVASSVGITFLAAGAVYYRFAWQTQGADVPLVEILATFSLAVGASVGMEYWARWAHNALWHDSLWSMHESHHRPRDGPFEMNDIFAIINAVPAIALMAYGFFHTGLIPGLCFGAGLGITVFGMAYMFVHDGLVHRRFPVGPVANVPYLQKVAAAHQLHHADKFKGVPFGLFLGPQELESQPGGAEELAKMIQVRIKLLASDREE